MTLQRTAHVEKAAGLNGGSVFVLKVWGLSFLTRFTESIPQ